MKKYLNLFIIFSIFIGCKDEKPIASVAAKKSDSIKQKVDYEFDENSVFGVYQLTDKDFAICIPVQFDNENLPFSKEYKTFLVKDSLPWIYGKDMKDYTYYDTLFVHQLIYNKRFEDVFKKKMKENFFVYGTKSSQKCDVKKVVFQSNECGSDYIAYILKVDKNTIGNPLIASEKEIPLSYGKNYSEINPSIKKFASKESTENTYGLGNYHPVVYSHYNSLYFTYYDDFQWFDENSTSNCQFPERAIFDVNSQGKIKLLWSSEMDLLGLPCL